MGIKGTEDCIMMSDSPWYCVCQCDLRHIGSCLLRVVWAMQCWGSALCVLLFSREPCRTTFSSVTSQPSKSWMTAEEGGEETGLWTITQSPSAWGHGRFSWITWLVRISSRLSESHPESENIDAAFRLCKACILKWSRCHQAINLLLKWWQC